MQAKAATARRRLTAAARGELSGAPRVGVPHERSIPDFSPYFSQDNEDGDMLLIPFGLAPDLDAMWSLLVTLKLEDSGKHELAFCLVESFRDGRTEQHFDGRSTAGAFTGEERSTIRLLITEAVAWLVIKVGPARLVWSTQEPTPAKALAKFLLIARSIEDCGYSVSRSRMLAGLHEWTAERRPRSIH